jgi:hypothetical protein
VLIIIHRFLYVRGRISVACRTRRMSWKAEKWRKAEERRLRKEGKARELGEMWAAPEEGDDDDDDAITRGENFREVAWIWTVAGTAGTDEELEDGACPRVLSIYLLSDPEHVYSAAYRVVESMGMELAVDGGGTAPRGRVEASARQLRTLRAGVAEVRCCRPNRVHSICGGTREGRICCKASTDVSGFDCGAERMRTEPKLAKGKRRQVFAPTWDAIIPTDNDELSNAGNDEGAGDDDGDDDDERGDVDSDEELLMGGEVDED